MDLPDLVLFKVFDYLTIDELILIRTVSKRLKYLINEYKIKELIVRDRHDVDYNWYFTYKPVNLNNSIFIYWRNHIYDYPHFRTFFRHCKRMKLRLNNDFSYDCLDEFKNLEHLEVDNNLYYLYGMAIVNLPNLKILKILIQSTDGKLTINSEKLEIICLSRFETIQLVNPQTVRQLQVESYENENLKDLKNLEIFRCNHASNTDSLIAKLPDNLKEIHAFDFTTLLIRDEELTMINRILEQRSKFQNLSVYFKSIKINEANIDRNSPNFNNNQIKNKFALLSKNFDSLEDKVSWIVDFEYNLLMNAFNNQLPVNFHNKFVNIHHIETKKKIEDQNHFYEFLRNCRNLVSLVLDCPSLNQEFYDKLADIPFFIEHLSLMENEVELDCQFVLKLKLLTDFITNQDLSMQLITDISMKLSYIRRFDLKFEGTQLVVDIDLKKWFNLVYNIKNDRKVWRYLTKDEYLNVCKDLERDYKRVLPASKENVS